MTTINILLDSTAILVFMGVGYLFTFPLISAYWRDVIKALPVRTFFLAKCIQSCSWFLVVMRGDIPDFLTISAANSLLFIGASFETIALLRLRNEWIRSYKWMYRLVIPLSIVGFHLVMLIHNEENTRIAYCSLILPIILAPLYRLTKGPSPLMKVIGYIYLFVIGANLIRGATALFTDIPASFYTPGIYQLFYLVTIYILTILSTMGFLLMWKEKSNQELLHYASYDDLTGVLNRRTFMTKAKYFLESYAKKRETVSYLLFDIDNFKTINDKYGHHTGDLVLKDITRRIRQQLDENDLFVRYGGDEFGILLPGKGESESSALAERIKKTLESSSRSMPVAYTISMGVLTLVPDQLTHMESIYTRCDQALYTAKRNGKNNIFRSQVS